MQFSFRIKKNTDFVFDCLTDMQRFVSVHPVITKIDSTGKDTYLVHETLQLEFIPFSFTYPVSIEKNAAVHTVVMRATVFKITSIEMKFAVKAEADYTLIEEEITFKSPLPIKYIMQGIFRKQHTQLFKNIELK